MNCDICNGTYPLEKHNFNECYSRDINWDLKHMDTCDTGSTGSTTAKNGYKEEEFMVSYINKNEYSVIRKLGCPSMKACVKPGNTKTDIIWTYNIQHKKTKDGQFGQVCRHWLDYMHTKVPMSQSVLTYLRGMCELPLDKKNNKMCDRSSPVVKLKRENYTERQLNSIILYFEKNKKRLLEMIFLGYDDDKPKILSCTVFKKKKRHKLMMWEMNVLIEYFCTQICKIRKSGTVIEIGSCLTFQRKGGDNGKKQANQFQFKLIPTRIQTPPFLVKIFND